MTKQKIAKFDVVTFKNDEFKQFALIRDYFLVTNANEHEDTCEIRALNGFLHKGNNTPIFNVKKQYLDIILFDSYEFKRNLQNLEKEDTRTYVPKDYPFQILDIVTIKPEWLNPNEENQYNIIIELNDFTGWLELMPLTGPALTFTFGYISPCHKDYVIKQERNENTLIAIYKLLNQQQFI